MYRYRCPQCRTTSPAVPSHRAAQAEGQRHRDRFHGGHHPDAEEILTPTKPWKDAPTGDKAVFFTVLAILLILALARLLS
ncbi:hypothetical protein [Streptomyces barkulensis]|uniref:hypothetical protein n=1 Tax=Streptomyces barkulensis TaxID=1257026 RepID=UPI000C6D1AC2|nr:hypothetical protein [Streptomyces barkulensis]